MSLTLEEFDQLYDDQQGGTVVEEIGKDTPLELYDIVELHFINAGLIGEYYMHAAESGMIGSLRDRGFALIGEPQYSSTGVVYTVQVVSPVDEDGRAAQAGLGGVVTVAFIAAAALGISAMWYFSLDKQYRLKNSPGGMAASVGLGLAGLGLVAAVLYIFFGRGK